MRKPFLLAVSLSIVASLFLNSVPALAGHSWSTYHWARTSNPFTVKLGDNVTSQWDAYLGEASTDWTKSTVLDTTIVAGSVSNVKRCVPPTGKVEVCNASYGFNGWLGVAGIYLTGGHIYKGYVKLNDSYFNTSTYNKPEWRRLVTCQEVGHTFGLDHQDENFNNANLGTCMDYTNNPLGPPSNEHPNAHDYDQLETIYSHLDSSDTTGSTTAAASSAAVGGLSDFDVIVDIDAFGNGTVTWILWVN